MGWDAVKVTVRDGGGGCKQPRYDPQGYGVRLQCYGEGPRGLPEPSAGSPGYGVRAQCKEASQRPAGAQSYGVRVQQ